jgi:hypothetical protein
LSIPAEPPINPVFISVKKTEPRNSEVSKERSIHSSPPFEVLNSIPYSPTAHPVFSSQKKTEYKDPKSS